MVGSLGKLITCVMADSILCVDCMQEKTCRGTSDCRGISIGTMQMTWQGNESWLTVSCV